jgi:subtilisin family serine protease
VGETDEWIFEVAAGTENSVAATLMASGFFEYVEPDWTVYPIGCPNDPQFGAMWHHMASRMNSCDGWDLETGVPTVVVAICDTGVRKTHADLQLHRVEGYNAVDKQWEFSGGKITDINGHGTLTTGCAAANGDNSIGVTGTGWNLSHRMMRVSNDSSGGSSIATLTHAVRTAADQGDKVASVSYSGGTSSSVNTAGTYIKGKGGLLVWAADNGNNKYLGTRDDDVVIVGATDSGDGKASFSSYGPYVDLFAPGTSILSTNSSGGYSTASGTSFATPLTAGLLGLIFSGNPSLTPDQAEAALRWGCDDLGPTGEDNTFGFGRIDVGRTMSLVVEYTSLFSDDFESGDFATGGWVTKNLKPRVLKRASHDSTWGARVKRSTWIERSVSTAGYHSIFVKFNRRTKNFDSGEELIVEWWDGAAWNTLEDTSKIKWTMRTFEVAPGADDNANFKLRFRTNGNEGKERADIDDVDVLGIKI